MPPNVPLRAKTARLDSMGSTARLVRNQHQKEIARIFDCICGKFSRWEVWSDFITLSAISVSNTVDLSNMEERENTYLTIASKYKQSELNLMTTMFAEIINGIDENPEQDFLGELYMRLELGNDHAGQFFTPYSVCQAMAAITSIDLKNRLKKKHWISVNDPACGAGALLVAFANECTRQHINYQTDVLFVAQDIDYIVGMMCYLQMSLMGCPGYVVIGNTISDPCICYDQSWLFPCKPDRCWFTPFYFRDVWHWRRIWTQIDMTFHPLPQPKNDQEVVPAALDKCHKSISHPDERATRPIATPSAQVSFTEIQNGQLSLF